jgi:NADH:ubiquinone oxidoreductase subunit F (NADH-binding)/(2Fe-2S) ferredoxin
MKTIEDINLLRENAQNDIKPENVKVFVHMGTCGIASGAMSVLAALKTQIKESDFKNITIITTGCAGICSQEPLISVEIPGKEPVIYKKMDAEKMVEVFNKHIIGHNAIAEYALARGMEYQLKDRMKNQGTLAGQEQEDLAIPAIEDIPFFNLQELRVMKNRGVIDPSKINDYLARGGYEGAIKAISEMTSEEIINELINSGLRGRGGAGFPIGLKWKFAAMEHGDTKYVLCNADEGDPGAYMDRNVMESDPHSVIEGMIIGAKAIGATQGYIYCRAEYPLAIETLAKAIKQARALNLLGKNILGTDLSFDIDIYEGAGAFVCGEETALMRSIEGKRGNPRPKPPFPAKAGLWEKPTVLNNVETLANVAQIIIKGSDWYREIGTEKSPGTKIFSITGDIENVGCVEVPIGTTIDTIVNKIGNVQEGKVFKAAQLGGPSGGCIPKQHMDVKADYETLQEYGAIMGSGGLIVISEGKSAVDIAKFFSEFCKDEACGKCIPGREGTKQMLHILNKISDGHGSKEDIQKLESLSAMMQKTALCALCKTSVNPVLSTLRYFRNEYEEAIDNQVKEGCY